MFWVRWREAFRRRRAEAQKVRSERQKKVCVEGRMMSLCVRYETMVPCDIVDELYRMHECFEMPIYYCTPGSSLALLPILGYLGAHPDCAAGDADRLVQMLQWPEVKRFVGDNSCRIAILDICE